MDNKSALENIKNCVKDKINFLVSGGAGSGKTYTLMKTIDCIKHEYPSANIACITFTNNAADVITMRCIEYSDITVCTIHNFLWDNIKNYQNNLRECLLLKLQEDRHNINISDNTNKIQYQNYRNLEDGIISHDDVIDIAHRMFAQYTKLCQIIKDSYQFILIDEYQDTFIKVIEIFKFLDLNDKKMVLGLFGDSMQNIYDSENMLKRIGDNIKQQDYIKIISYKNNNNINDKSITDKTILLQEIILPDNRRNPRKIIELANKLRDGIDNVQQNTENILEISCPNRNADGRLKEGTIKFYYVKNAESINKELINKIIREELWTGNEKQLHLTQKLISQNLKYQEIYNLYDKDIMMILKKDINKITQRFTLSILADDTFAQVVSKICSEVYQNNLNSNLAQLSKDPKKNYEFIRLVKNMQSLKTTYIDQNEHLYEQIKDLCFKKHVAVDKDNLLKPEDHDPLIKHLFKLREILELYRSKNFNQFLKETNYKLNLNKDKLILADYINDLINDCESSNIKIKDILEKAIKYKILTTNKTLEQYKKDSEYFYNQVVNKLFVQFQAVYDYVTNQTPLATQHSIKGEEYDNILLLLDNGKWSDYDFSVLFNIDDSVKNQNTLNRTKKIFYTCITRVKANLIILYPQSIENNLKYIQELFGIDNVKEVE